LFETSTISWKLKIPSTFVGGKALNPLTVQRPVAIKDTILLK
jgi:hypothetical protein